MKKDMSRIIRQSIKSSGVKVYRTSGLFLDPFQPAAMLPEIRIHILNPQLGAVKAGVRVNVVSDDTKKRICQEDIEVPGRSGADTVVKLAEYEGSAVEVNLVTPDMRLKPSVSLLQVFSGDGTEELAQYISPQQFSVISFKPQQSGIGRYSSGLFYIPVMTGNKPDLRVYLSNFENQPGLADVTVFDIQNNNRRMIIRRRIVLAAGGAKTVKQDLSNYTGHMLEVVLRLRTPGLKPSLAVVKNFLADGGEQTLLWLSPNQFVKASPSRG